MKRDGKLEYRLKDELINSFIKALNARFKMKEEKRKFSTKYYVEGNDEDVKIIIERYMLGSSYEIFLFNQTGKIERTPIYSLPDTKIIKIVCCVAGTCSVIRKNNRIYTLKKGDILIYNVSNTDVKDLYLESKDSKNIILFLDMNRLESDLLDSSIDKKILSYWRKKVFNIFKNDTFCYGKSNSQINILTSQIENIEITNINEYFQFKMKILQLLFMILEIQIKSLENIMLNNEKITKKIKSILKKYSIEEMPSMKEISGIMGLSNYQIQSSFKNIEGLSVSQYIRKKKMEYAKKLLKTTDINILDIAIEIGYENPSKFSIAFKKIFGILPNKYRKKIKS